MTATATSARSDLSELGRSETALRNFLHGLPGVDQVGAEQRAAQLGTRSIKTTAKARAIDLAIRMVDLTTLEGADTPGKVRALAAKALRPDPADPSCPHVGAVCVYPAMVPYVAEVLRGSAGSGRPSGGPDGNAPAGPGVVHLASVATAFPSGQAPLEVKLADTRAAVAAGADEIDMVINRGAFLAGRYREVYDEIVATKQACGDAHLKVILETGELATYDNVRRASWLAMLAGGDFIKTSTGKVPVAATLPVTLVMLEAVRDFRAATGRQVGVKPAGGIKNTKDAIKYLVMVNETVGPDWLDPDWFRFGASSLLNDLLMQRTKLTTGVYSGPDYFTLD
ncbi:deoxyribose-phosphate aldolase [Micromonospora sp. ATCC 39149]|uniref:Deoxyribose-phosphate aldolase n=1 Tax=Micromonospora carbonacea TaxID=47853 RepID=A0A7D6CF60_9ACTN|nr:deoxyribose-phosphate aldolase [Micromonospora sp. ATCC 39149]EEP73268.1 deoxyribose-phosphate aldolase [Micromonospora sp. ATCC 39149]QLJ99288.1 deoxyribose-phosphate aldolase [Micromonospora carbonacea]